MIDTKRTCSIQGCNNLGEYDKANNGKIYRRKLCTTHKRKIKNNTFKSRIDNRRCVYCGWLEPCDRHRPLSGVSGGSYIANNIRSTCPNCHRLISLGLIKDKFLGPEQIMNGKDINAQSRS